MIFIFPLCSSQVFSQEKQNIWPQRVLSTNDNRIEAATSWIVKLSQSELVRGLEFSIRFAKICDEAVQSGDLSETEVAKSAPEYEKSWI